MVNLSSSRGSGAKDYRCDRAWAQTAFAVAGSKRTREGERPTRTKRRSNSPNRERSEGWVVIERRTRNASVRFPHPLLALGRRSSPGRCPTAAAAAVVVVFVFVSVVEALVDRLTDDGTLKRNWAAQWKPWTWFGGVDNGLEEAWRCAPRRGVGRGKGGVSSTLRSERDGRGHGGVGAQGALERVLQRRKIIRVSRVGDKEQQR